PHGAVCAALLAPVWEANSTRVQDRTKFAQVDAMLGGDAVSCLHALTARLLIPKLSQWGIAETDLNEIAHKAAAASSMKANPVSLTHDDLVQILRAAL
ncbi:MAG: iron-containing alcohol dehydrogenase, partial [Prosthecobacter sp.]